MEGSLEGSDSYLRREYADYYPFARLGASTHFGVGLWNGTPQIRQWVDTVNSAYGWAAAPTAVPTAVAKAVFGDQLYGKTTWPYYGARTDLNRHVIAIEVEGFASQAWESRTTAKVKELLVAISRFHGPLWVTAHTDMSIKVCPGMATFNAALPGYYGRRLGSLPNTSTSTTIPRADGAPVAMRFTAMSRAATIKAGKPIRSGASIRAKTVATTTKAQSVRLVGAMRPTGSYDPWYLYAYYLGNGHAFCYSPGVDVTLR